MRNFLKGVALNFWTLPGADISRAALTKGNYDSRIGEESQRASTVSFRLFHQLRHAVKHSPVFGFRVDDNGQRILEQLPVFMFVGLGGTRAFNFS